MIIDSSTARHEVFDRLGKPKSKEDAVNMLGDQSGKVHTVFRENGGNEYVKTIAVGKNKNCLLFKNQKSSIHLFSYFLMFVFFILFL